MAGRAEPAQQDHAIARSEDIVRLIDQAVIGAGSATIISRGLQTGPYRHFTLYLRVKSTGAPTDVRFVVEFLEESSGLWHAYNQGPFVSLYYEDADTATEVDDVYQGDCMGRALRVRVVAQGTTAALTFTVSAAVELWT